MRSVLATRCSEMRRQQGSLKGCPASAGYKCDRGAKHGVIGCSTEILAIILNHFLRNEIRQLLGCDMFHLVGNWGLGRA